MMSLMAEDWAGMKSGYLAVVDWVSSFDMLLCERNWSLKRFRSRVLIEGLIETREATDILLNIDFVSPGAIYELPPTDGFPPFTPPTGFTNSHSLPTGSTTSLFMLI